MLKRFLIISGLLLSLCNLASQDALGGYYFLSSGGHTVIGHCHLDDNGSGYFHCHTVSGHGSMLVCEQIQNHINVIIRAGTARQPPACPSPSRQSPTRSGGVPSPSFHLHQSEQILVSGRQLRRHPLLKKNSLDPAYAGPPAWLRRRVGIPRGLVQFSLPRGSRWRDGEWTSAAEVLYQVAFKLVIFPVTAGFSMRLYRRYASATYH